MTDEKMTVLRLLEEGKISIDEAQKLLDAVEGGSALRLDVAVPKEVDLELEKK